MRLIKSDSRVLRSFIISIADIRSVENNSRLYASHGFIRPFYHSEFLKSTDVGNIQHSGGYEQSDKKSEGKGLALRGGEPRYQKSHVPAIHYHALAKTPEANRDMFLVGD